jgi:hypothetical protein
VSRSPGRLSQKPLALFSFSRGHDHQAGENQGDGGKSAPLLPAPKGRGRRLGARLAPGLLAAQAGDQKNNEAHQGQDLSEAAFFHALPTRPSGL